MSRKGRGCCTYSHKVHKRKLHTHIYCVGACTCIQCNADVLLRFRAYDMQYAYAPVQTGLSHYFVSVPVTNKHYAPFLHATSPGLIQKRLRVTHVKFYPYRVRRSINDNIIPLEGPTPRLIQCASCKLQGKPVSLDLHDV